MPQRKTFLSETSRELIERSYRVRARLRETLEEARRSDRKRDRARPSQRARESGEERDAGVKPNPIHPTDAAQGSGSSGAEPIAKR